ncbi:uncharacterized protein LOC127005582 isoform X1 [Eriocheir sinensis]|uniref:uncharacterized protein LOC127005582 isoform X1 n=1 Tax=Eriocheir sinensis TaxID=95602 RepID=UPI0021C89D54|nr:uncharacterized protein LOC127005582 isoform X1 [Eriocheir sinensis]
MNGLYRILDDVTAAVNDYTHQHHQNDHKNDQENDHKNEDKNNYNHHQSGYHNEPYDQSNHQNDYHNDHYQNHQNDNHHPGYTHHYHPKNHQQQGEATATAAVVEEQAESREAVDGTKRLQEVKHRLVAQLKAEEEAKEAEEEAEEAGVLKETEMFEGGDHHAPHIPLSFSPPPPRPDPFFLMEAPQLGTHVTPPTRPHVGGVSVGGAGGDYSVQVSSKFGIDEEIGGGRPVGGGFKGTVEDLGTVGKIGTVRGTAEDAVYGGKEPTRAPDDHVRRLRTKGEVELLEADEEEDGTARGAEGKVREGSAAREDIEALTHDFSPSASRHDAYQGLNLDLLSNRVFQLLTPPPPSAHEHRLNPQYTPFPITTNPPRTTPVTLTPIPTRPPGTPPSMVFSPIPEADFVDAFSPAVLPEGVDEEENAILESPSPPRVIAGDPIQPGGDNPIRRVSAAPLRISNEGVYSGGLSDTTTQAMTGGGGGGDDGHPTDFTAHEQVWSFPKTREEDPWIPKERKVEKMGEVEEEKEEINEEAEKEEEEEEEEEEEKVPLTTPQDSPARVYTAFYSPREIPGIDPSLFGYRKMPQPGKGDPQTPQGTPWKERPEAHHPLGPEFHEYLMNLPPDTLMRFLQPGAMRAKRAASEGEQIYCEWNIKTEPGLYLLLTFHNLSAAYSVDCHGAYIEVERENNGYDARWCGNRVSPGGTRPHVIFAKSEVRVTVYDDGDHSKSTPTGFTADVEVIDLFNARDYNAFMRSNAHPHIRRLLHG